MPFRLFILMCLGALYYQSTKALWPIVWVFIGITLEIIFYLWSRKTRPILKEKTDFTTIRLWNDGLTFVILASWTTGASLFYLADVPAGRTASLLILTAIGTSLAHQPGRFALSSFINAAVPGGLLIVLSLLHVNQPGGGVQLFVSCLISIAIFILVFLTRQAHAALYHSLAQQRALTYALAKAHDTADSKRSQAESLAKAKADFIAVMSHEVRTPLNGVLGMAEALACSDLDADQKQQVALITDSGHLLLKIANNILDLSMSETGHMHLNRAAVNLDNLIDPGLNLWRKRAEAKGLGFFIERADTVPRLIAADETRLRQILFNLIENAVKFTTKGEIALHILRENKDSPSDSLRFLVSDTGIGIASPNHKRIFDRFTKVENELTRNSDGAGLGLAIVKELVELMDGQVTLESVPGKGSIFSFTIPCEPLPTARRHQPEPVGIRPPWRRTIDKNQPPRFLIVDDNEINHRVLDAILAPYHSDNIAVMSGRDAVAAFKDKGPFTLIFMDMRMPGMDGVETIKYIRSMEMETKTQTPILALTANVNQSDEMACMTAGANAYLTKPLDIGKVYAMVRFLTGYDMPENAVTPAKREILSVK